MEYQPKKLSDLQTLLDRAVKEPGIPGVSAVLVQGDKLLWSGAAGFANIDRGAKMTADHILNIASVSKLITATAVMQQVERGKLNLDQDVNNYLSFPVRNPNFPDVPITVRQLLIHRSSITDGPTYGQSYACGDPAVALGDWVEGYLKPDGQFYSATENFLNWSPGTVNPPTPPRAYSNVAFGLLGHLVERLSGDDFESYCRTSLFDVIGMKDTRWKIGDVLQHAVPYSYLGENVKLNKKTMLEDSLFADSVKESDIVKGAVIPHCLYSFYNYPDGLLRTSANELALFLRAYISGGQLNGERILKEDTVKEILSEQHEGQGLGWTIGASSSGERFFEHGGGDPGVSTFAGFRERDQSGVIVLFNCSNPGEHMGSILNGMFTMMNNFEEQGLD